MIKLALSALGDLIRRALCFTGCCRSNKAMMDKDENVGAVTRSKNRNLDAPHDGCRPKQTKKKSGSQQGANSMVSSRRSFPPDNYSCDTVEDESPTKQRRTLYVRDHNILPSADRNDDQRTAPAPVAGLPKPRIVQQRCSVPSRREYHELCKYKGIHMPGISCMYCPDHEMEMFPPKQCTNNTASKSTRKKKRRESQNGRESQNDSAYFSYLHSLPDFRFDQGRMPETPPAREITVPNLIKNIDTDPDSVDSNIYALTIMDYILKMEDQYAIKPDFLEKSPEVTTRMRGVLMDWILQVQHHEDMNVDSLHLTVHLIDEVLSRREVTMARLQLVGITCLLIAAKFTERFSPTIQILCYLTEDTFTRQEVLQCEIDILWLIDFRLTRPVAPGFLGRLLQVHQADQEMDELAHYILDLTITSADLVPALPSKKAAGALYVARWVLLDDEDLWDDDLVYYSTYDKETLSEVVQTIVHILHRAPNSKYQGAFNKYSNTEGGGISTDYRLEPHNIQERMRRTDMTLDKSTLSTSSRE